MASPVSEHDRAAMQRQAEALARGGDAAEDRTAEASVVAAENARRAVSGAAPLGEWWSGKTESEFHERARALGLLRRVR